MTTAVGRVFDPYDCAAQSSTGPLGNRTKYCLQSRFYSCVTRIHCPVPELGGDCDTEVQARVAAFLVCADVRTGPSGVTSFEHALPCAKEYSLDTSKILACYNPSDLSPSGPALSTIHAVDNATRASAPPVSAFPDVRVNGRQISGQPTAAKLIQATCAAYTGPHRPQACS